MAKVNFEITIRGKEAEQGVVHFEPGETLQGSATVMPESKLDCRHLYARLVWHTEGRGERDRGVAAEMDLYQGLLHAGTPTYHTFHFKLPEGPWSYAGYYINILWEVEVSIDLAWAPDPRSGTPFILAPRRS